MAPEVDRLWVHGTAFPHSTKQVNKAGDRIRRATTAGEQPEERDLALLDLYRSSHYPGSREVQERLTRLLHKKMGLKRIGGAEEEIVVNTVSARPLKTHQAITAKLVRERSRLATIQDIGGSRIVVVNAETQEAIRQAIFDVLPGLDPRVSKDSRTEADDLGYRALHIVVVTDHPGVGKRPAEIQIRTIWQEAWAQVVEEVDAMYQTDLKHGDGPADARAWLLELSRTFQARERGETVTMPVTPKSLS